MSGNVDTLALDGELTVQRAAELKPVLMAALDTAPALQIDLAAVTEIDSAGVQLLLLTRRTAARRQRALQLVGHSAAVLQAFALLELHALFTDPIVVPELPQ